MGNHNIFLFWWNTHPNIGDFASYYLMSRITNKNITRKDPNMGLKEVLKCLVIYIIRRKGQTKMSEYLFPWQKVIFSIGSILEGATKNTIVWGTGARESTSIIKAKDIRAVRGKLTKELISNKDVALGDPALLLPLVYSPKETKKKWIVSIIPHFSEYDFFKMNYSKRYNILDIRSNDVEKFIDDIVASEFILSSSLHGIIIAQAYGIPALWIKHGYIYSSDFKFHDYFSSVAIPLYSGFQDIDNILKSYNTIKKLFENHKDKSLIQNNLSEIQNKLINTCPVQDICFHAQHP